MHLYANYTSCKVECKFSKNHLNHHKTRKWYVKTENIDATKHRHQPKLTKSKGWQDLKKQEETKHKHVNTQENNTKN